MIRPACDPFAKPLSRRQYILSRCTIFALAAEIGWRGYFLPHLLPVGQRRALLLS
jgi:hypothetical protein